MFFTHDARRIAMRVTDANEKNSFFVIKPPLILDKKELSNSGLKNYTVQMLT